MVELIVAVGLSAMLLAGVLAIFSSSRVSYEAIDRLSRVQESGRLALDQLVRDVRSAGYNGCVRKPVHVSTSLARSDELQWNLLDSPVRGYQYTHSRSWMPQLDPSNVPDAAENSDVLLVRGPKPNVEPVRLRANMTSGADALLVSNPQASALRAGDVALAYNCEARAYFHVSSFDGETITHDAPATPTDAPGNARATIDYAFSAGTEIIPVQTVIYYVHSNAAGRRSLWRRVGLQKPEEFVEDVEQMQLQFGVDNDGDTTIDDYLTADAVANWSSVVSVSIALLVRSSERGTDPDQKAYQLLDVVVPATADGHLREVFTAVASVRNRTLVD